MEEICITRVDHRRVMKQKLLGDFVKAMLCILIFQTSTTTGQLRNTRKMSFPILLQKLRVNGIKKVTVDNNRKISELRLPAHIAYHSNMRYRPLMDELF